MGHRIIAIEKKATLAPGGVLEVKFTPGLPKSCSAEVTAVRP